MLLPFVVMLSGVAFCPLLLPVWWETNRNKAVFSLLLALPVMSLLSVNGYSRVVVDQMLYDYLPFVVLVGTLFVVTGGINLRLNLRPTPWNNVLILAVGYLLASFMGTTGAALLLVRPLLEVNRTRRNKAHLLLFFIALVANCGGLLTPLGDPPLFMLFLRGVPFVWFLRLYPAWLFVGGVLLLFALLSDLFFYRKECGCAKSRNKSGGMFLSCSGKGNLLCLLCVVFVVAFVNEGYLPFMADESSPGYLRLLREILLLVIAIVSWLTTGRAVRRACFFSWAPFVEVVILFFGIFATMTPVLLFLQSHAEEIGVVTPVGFYYATGALSSFLDNTPTAVAFHTLAMRFSIGFTDVVSGVRDSFLAAVSMGAVFFGSMTYIGNGPNFMIKSIAERDGVRMPGFLGYVCRFSLPLLLPVFVLVQQLFLCS